MALSLENIKYSLNNIAHRKTRSLLTILSIFLGISTIFIFISFGWGLYDYIDSVAAGGSSDKVMIQPKGMGGFGLDDTFYLTEQDVRAVEKSNGVYSATGVYIKIGKVEKRDEQKYIFVSGYDPQNPLVMQITDIRIESGRELQRGDDGMVTLGYDYKLDNKIFSKGLSLNDKITIEGKDFRVAGFYAPVGNPQDDSNVYLTADSMKKLYSDIKGFSWIVAKVDKTKIPSTVDAITRSLRNSRNLKEGKEDFYVQSFEDLVKSYTSALNIVIGFVILIALISVLVSAINTSNTMITSVLERFKEIGIIKAIGAKNSEIFNIFLFESGFLGFVAGVIGVGWGFLITSIANTILVNLGWGFLSPHYSYSLFIGCILFATITGAVSGVLPAIRASKINVVQALRYE
ncbi:MacB-like periplasmic core domain protein [uncultured archaeon]|nr:MacB-like periplasmic core domain protein [uncultured archaeon]